jgi:hypothetical protein
MTSAAVFEPASMKFQCIKIVRLHDIVLTKGSIFTTLKYLMIVSQFQPRSANICAICALAKFKSV